MRLFALSTVCAILAIFAARILGPSDLWGQTQPRTIAYTADMLSRGGEAWFLARDADGLYATKPPLYNWLAAPGVALLGRGSELAHRLPSLLCTLAVVALIVRWGERLGRSIGWLAALAWLAMFPTFKLAYLARPDMLLCLVTFVGWYVATRIVLDARSGRPTPLWRPALFWLTFALAAWTKGPTAVLLLAYAVIATWWLDGAPSTFLRFRPFTLGAAGLLCASLWYLIAFFISPEHFRETLVYGEVVGRMTGNGPEGNREGPIMILIGLPVMTFYFIARFAPWSIPAILGAIALVMPIGRGLSPWKGGRDTALRTSGSNGIAPGQSSAFLWGAVVWTATVIALFSISSGKRADYIAPVYAPAALVGAWWMLCDRNSPIRRQAWIAPTLAALTLTVHIAVDHGGTVISRDSMIQLSRIVDRVNATRGADGATPLVVLAPQLPHVAVLCGDSAPFENTPTQLRAELDEHGRALALVAAGTVPQPIRGLLRSGHAQELWSMPVPEDAARAGVTRGVTMYELIAPAKGIDQGSAQGGGS
jgi:4-amino-4-deoxy-L-arabinose transferase-like glycosyltransferase